MRPAAVEIGTEPPKRGRLDLPHALACEMELACDLLERLGLPVGCEAESTRDDSPLTRREGFDGSA